MSEIEFDETEFSEDVREYADQLEQQERRDLIRGDVALIEEALDAEIARSNGEWYGGDDEDAPAPRPAVTPSDLRAAYEAVSRDYPDLGDRADEIMELVRSKPDVFGTPSSRQDLERALRTSAAMLEQNDAALTTEAVRVATDLYSGGQLDIHETLFQLAQTVDLESPALARFIDGIEDYEDRIQADEWRTWQRSQKRDVLEALEYQAAEAQEVEAQEIAEAQAALLMQALQTVVDRHPDADALSYEAAKTVVGAIESGLVQVETPQDLADTVDLAFGAAREDRRTAIADDFGNQLLAKANGYIFENGRMVDPRDGSVVEGVGSLTPDYSGLTTSADDLTSRERQQVFLQQFGRTAIRPRSDFREEADKAAVRADKQAQLAELRRRGFVK